MTLDQLMFIREGQPTDTHFICGTWLPGLYYGNPFYREIDRVAFFENYIIAVQYILKKSHVLIACLNEDPDVILGYAVFNGNVLHWVYVKKPWRNIGIAKKLVPIDIETVTHLTTVGKDIIKHSKIFNPFKI